MGDPASGGPSAGESRSASATGPRLLLVGLGVALGLLLAEGLLALLAPQTHRLPEVWDHDPGLGWRHIPGASGRLVTPEFDVEYRIDANGLRAHSWTAGVAAAGPAAAAGSGADVLLFGDSFAEGWGVEAAEGLAAQLEAALALAQCPAVVHNFGVAGYGTDQELLLFQGRAGLFEPDLVLLLFYGNDLWNNISRRGIGAQRGLKPRFEPVGQELRLTGVPVPRPPPRRADPWRYLAERWHLAALLRRAWPEEEVPAGQLAMYYGALYGRDDEAIRVMWELTRRLLAIFDSQVQRAGGRFAVVYAPAIVQIEADDWRAKRELASLTGELDLAKPNRRLGEICEAQGIPYLDLCPEFASGTALFYRDSHWTPAGHSLAARAVARFLLRHGLVPQGGLTRGQ